MPLPDCVIKDLPENTTSGHFPCPYTGCKAVSRSQVSFEIHCKYFHKDIAGNERSESSGKDGSQTMRRKFQSAEKHSVHDRSYCCEETECVNKSGVKKQFKTYAVLKQHYFNVHAKKIFSCKKCSRMFSEKSKKLRHESECLTKFVCSCGISYHGKIGLLVHIKRTKHKLPEALEEYFSQKYVRKCPNKKGKTTKKAVASVLPKGAFSTPALTFQRKGAATILPKGFSPSLVLGPSFSNGPSNRKLHPQSHPTNLLPKTARNCFQSRFIIDVIHPTTNTTVNVKSTKPEVSLTEPEKLVFLQSEANLDSLSTAMITSGITTPIGQSSRPQTSQELCIQSKTSQTDWSVGSQPAQDFSCQTDEFLAWLDSESARCSPDQSRTETSSDTQTQTAIQQLDTTGISNEIATSLDHVSIRTVAQNETQTDDDWLSALLHETESITNVVSDAESQTRVGMYQNMDTNYNTNANNNHGYVNVESDSACDIQTQTALMESVTDVTTQTSDFHHLNLDSSNSSSFFINFATDIHTQTETSYSLVNTTCTQTAWQCDDLTEFLNMETQTDSFAQIGF